MERQASHNCDRSSKVNSRVGRLPGKVSQKWESGKASWKCFVEGPDSVMIIISPHLVTPWLNSKASSSLGARSGGGRAEGAGWRWASTSESGRTQCATALSWRCLASPLTHASSTRLGKLWCYPNVHVVPAKNPRHAFMLSVRDRVCNAHKVCALRGMPRREAPLFLEPAALAALAASIFSQRLWAPHAVVLCLCLRHSCEQDRNFSDFVFLRRRTPRISSTWTRTDTTRA